MHTPNKNKINRTNYNSGFIQKQPTNSLNKLYPHEFYTKKKKKKKQTKEGEKIYNSATHQSLINSTIPPFAPASMLRPPPSEILYMPEMAR